LRAALTAEYVSITLEACAIDVLELDRWDMDELRGDARTREVSPVDRVSAEERRED
jgi:hypothetical protein